MTATDDDARQAAVTALVRLAASPHHRDRADAGRGLASLADVSAARPVLLKLVLDPADTFVTQETAEALFRRGDALGFAVVSAAVTAADDEQADHLDAALHAVLGVFERERDAAVRIFRELTQDPAQPAEVRDGAASLVADLTALRPSLSVLN
ncbi:hypothetical protein SK854_09160 [Lentzea sp. BCCO 10_0061]|uniref:HEAT repeat protein n=1 Tax=Lentzea sokolovensis TaxID=3095429 RepID=A0ABU4UTE3_9PSEU|nr:hypothetical protein [Lentzea sp. BCCO 10_0061]MDX8142279.1 hypothetical protein [Lentzea sp. BCCO 10_0061]